MTSSAAPTAVHTLPRLLPTVINNDNGFSNIKGGIDNNVKKSSRKSIGTYRFLLKNVRIKI